MEELIEAYHVPAEKQMQLFTHIRLAHAFSDYRRRLQCVQARLQALSVLIYCNALADAAPSLLYAGKVDKLLLCISQNVNSFFTVLCRSFGRARRCS